MLQPSSAMEISSSSVREIKEGEEKKLPAPVAVVEVPEAFYCPLSGQIMFEAVMNKEERTYEHESILYWMGEPRQRARDPITMRELTDRTLMNNRFARDSIEAFLVKNPQFRAKQYLPVASMKKAIMNGDADRVRVLLALDTTYRFLTTQTDEPLPRSLKEMAATCNNQAIKNLFQRFEDASKAAVQPTNISVIPDQIEIPSPAFPEINHFSLLGRLITAFGVPPNLVYEGTVVEQSVVGLAGIETKQYGAEFRGAPDGQTNFKLRFVDDEARKRFRKHYDEKYPGLIRLMAVQGDFTRVLMKTSQFAAQTIPDLAGYYRSIFSVVAASGVSLLASGGAGPSVRTAPVSTPADVKQGSVSPLSASRSSLLPTPTHTELLDRLVEKFSSGRQPVYSGIAVEQSLVGLAGISTVQTDATFIRMPNGATGFKLRLNEADLPRFQEHYNVKHPGFIQTITAMPPFTQVAVDTVLLYNVVSAELGAHHLAANQAREEDAMELELN